MLPIKPILPFDLSTKIFADGDPQIRKYEDEKFWQAFKMQSIFDTKLKVCSREN